MRRRAPVVGNSRFVVDEVGVVPLRTLGAAEVPPGMIKGGARRFAAYILREVDATPPVPLPCTAVAVTGGGVSIPVRRPSVPPLAADAAEAGLDRLYEEGSTICDVPTWRSSLAKLERTLTGAGARAR